MERPRTEEVGAVPRGVLEKKGQTQQFVFAKYLECTHCFSGAAEATSKISVLLKQSKSAGLMELLAGTRATFED